MGVDAPAGKCTELVASRARMAAAAHEARRRLERDLHDGPQERLIAVLLELRTVQASLPRELGSLSRQLSHIVSGLAAASEDLQHVGRGLHPAIVSTAGLVPALKGLARRCPVPVTLDLKIDRRLADAVEVATYYVIDEALANAAKHAQASGVSVSVHADDQALCVCIADDGVGGADPRNGSGLVGLTDRIEALGGQIDVVSHRGAGTALTVTIPLDAR